VRDLVAYGVGRVLGEWLLAQPIAQRLIGRKRIARTRRMVEARGAGAVLFGRFLIGMRASVFLVTGAMGVSFRRFLFWDLVGLVVPVPAVVGPGHAFGEPLV